MTMFVDDDQDDGIEEGKSEHAVVMMVEVALMTTTSMVVFVFLGK